uniref:uncharacterized protein LOC122602173 isoform X2 n=1 Tax=Erigeron canadensis TaxID=72917 RepID=UPI001CB93BA3|nr:uncharacterized protein LOC122602173 isoform X2 [Erigeron canadensis]
MSIISSSCSCIEHCSNLENFLHSVTPITNHASVPINTSRVEEANGESNKAHLKLQDIWEIYDEWSACGVGVPVILKNGEQVVQYYVPYLSAIQIFMKKPKSSTSLEEEIDVVALRHGSPTEDDDDDDDSSPKTKEVTSKGFEIDHNYCHILVDRGNLYIQFYETCSPYLRVPFIDKIIELAQSYQGLFTFSINDISPASWMSVAWYPIYHIPGRVQICKDLCACFLTFHALSSSFQENKEEGVQNDENKLDQFVPFGLATYKMQEGDVWNNSDSDKEKIKDLHVCASSWLKKFHIQHPDHIFFTQ